MTTYEEYVETTLNEFNNIVKDYEHINRNTKLYDDNIDNICNRLNKILYELIDSDECQLFECLISTDKIFSILKPYELFNYAANNGHDDISDIIWYWLI